MDFVLHVGEPLEPQHHAVGHRTTLIVDTDRNGRALAVDCWYPASPDSSGERRRYELLPGAAFTASAIEDAAVAVGAHPLIVWSHGRTGTRAAYVMLCEGLASRGYVVVAPDHPGDTLVDWLLNAAADDPTNEQQRDGDIRLVLDTALSTAGNDVLPPNTVIDAERIAVGGHSYGANTALALCGSENPDPRVRAVAGFQSFTRSIRRSTIARINVPLLMVTGACDATTPPATDADRVFPAVTVADARRVDIERAGHQACTDVGLYIELAPQVPDLPDVVRHYVLSMADNITGTAGDPWRPVVSLHLQLLGSWLDDVLDRDRDTGRNAFAVLTSQPGVAITTNK